MALSWLYPYPDRHGRPEYHQRLWVRIITDTLTDPNRAGSGKTHRLMTSLLDAKAYSALDLIRAYHERWEVELTIDEVDTPSVCSGIPDEARSQSVSSKNSTDWQSLTPPSDA